MIEGKTFFYWLAQHGLN